MGRWTRLFFGLNSLIYLGLNPILLNPVPAGELADFAITRGSALLGLIAIYFVVFYFFGKFLFVRLSPWAGTAVFLGLPTLLGVLGYLPDWALMAFGLYIGLSLVLTFFMRYGGCEVVALPSILLGKRYTMYCPLNAIDCVERAVTPDAYSRGHKIFMLASLGIASLIGGYYYILGAGAVFSRYGLAFELDYRFSWLLVVPFFYAAYMAYGHYRKEKRLLAAPVRKFGMGAFVLLLMVINYGVPDFEINFWRWIMAAGSAYVVLEIVLVLIGKKKLREA